MKVFWASAAEQDRADIIDYISQDNPSRPYGWMSFSHKRLAVWLNTRTLARQD